MEHKGQQLLVLLFLIRDILGITFPGLQLWTSEIQGWMSKLPLVQEVATANYSQLNYERSAIF